MEQQQFIALIIKQISNDITADELLLLEEWLQASPDHRKLAGEYRQAWQMTPGEETQLLQPDLDTSYARLMLRIKPQPAAPFKVSYRFALLSAAAVALLVIALWAYPGFGGSETKMLTASSGDLEKKEIVLPDGTKVWLRKGSTLKYPAAFDGSKRDVQLDGEAFFEVAFDPARRFCVALPHSEKIEVLGTSFNVKPAADAVIVTVLSGKVRFKPDPSSTKDAVVSGGARAVYVASTAQLSVAKSPNNNDLAWQRGGLEFESTPLKQVIEDIESYFGVDIEIENKKMLDCTYSSNLLKGNVEDVLKGLNATFKMYLTNPSPNQFVLMGGTCL